ncbi:hypothetical protein D9611_007116 [Ephemerocybe angulata]|uniref:Sphingomyelin phosphodiesterase n=1 Tax=Ephemerocybe angulata TaxID=980116 RepID=A0A8H5EWF7_9AGAR|nr:hypothetical protein D9611_007116 [Tulosesus angulatus]
MRAFQTLYIYLTLALAAISVANASLVDDILDAIKNAATCATCHALFVPLKALAVLGDKPFTKTFVAVCKAAKVVDNDVCDGAVGMQAPIIAHDLRHINPLGQTATKLCNALLGLCQAPDVNTYKVPFPKAAPTTVTPVVAGRNPPFQVVHFSDVHIDREYTVGADAACTKPVCCRKYADQAGKPVQTPAKPNGMRNCDTPPSLTQNLLNSIGANNKFSIFTGDIVEAAVWLVTQDEVTKDIDLFTQEMTSIPQVKVYPALGNHESAPTNAFTRNTTTKTNMQWVFDAVSKGWQPSIGASAAQQAAKLSGSYALKVPNSNLKIISLNTVYWYKSNFWLYDSDNQQPDPNGIIEFAVRELQAAEDAGERVWIIGHMPPNRGDTLHDQSNYFDQVVNRYKATIAGQFYGHSHQDQFAISYSDYKKRVAENAVSVAWVAPAITPRSNNPGYKIYDVDPDTYEIMDAKIYRADIDAPNFHTTPKWDLTYSARALYSPMVTPAHPATTPLNPAFWHRVTEAFEKNQTAFDVYQGLRMGGGQGVNPIVCADDQCKTDTICDIRALSVDNSCSKTSPGLSFRRRADGIEVDGAEPGATGCESVGIGHVFHELVGKKDDIDFDELRAEIEAIVAEAEREAATQ